MKDQKVTLKYILSGILAVAITWIIHEFAHWLTSELLGYKNTMRLNGTSLVKGQNPSEIERAIISISGPIITILQGLIVYGFLKSRGWNTYLYPFLFTAFWHPDNHELQNGKGISDFRVALDPNISHYSRIQPYFSVYP